MIYCRKVLNIPPGIFEREHYAEQGVVCLFSIGGNVFAVCFRPFWNRCLPKCLNKDTMLLCNCKAKIKKLSTAFAIALMSARLEQTVC